MTIVTLNEPKKRGKYKVRHDRQGKENRTIDGIVFHSAKEAKRYWELRLLEKDGNICRLTLQPSYDLVVNGVHICKYVADFSYICALDGVPIATVEDVKGMKTREYKIKKRLMKALHNIDIVEI